MARAYHPRTQECNYSVTLYYGLWFSARYFSVRCRLWFSVPRFLGSPFIGLRARLRQA
jgi:hypothetical protein